MAKISDKTFVLLTTSLYAGFVSLMSYHHIPWRDEVVPMTVVTQSTSLSELCARIHSFGHPVLWYFLLYLAHHVIHAYSVLKVVNVLISVGAIALFLAKSPFSRLQKILFILGFFPLYLYPDINRNYGIGMLLLFAFAWAYPKRFEKMIPLGCIILLLANAHAHCLITAMAIAGALLAEFIFNPQSRQAWQKNSTQTMIGAALIITGIVYSAIQTIPDHNNIIYDPHSFSMRELTSALVKSIFMPGKAFISVMGVYSALFTTFVVLWMYIYLFAKPYLFIFFGCTVVALSLFYHLIFQSDEMRHQGALFLLLITIFWIEPYIPQVRLGNAVGKFRDHMVRYKEPLFMFLLILQICMAYPAVTDEMTSVYSSSKALGEMLKGPQFKDAVLVGEPGAMLEAVPYYADNMIYMPREGKFKKYTDFTTKQSLRYSLTELLISAKTVEAQTGKTVLIVLGHKLSDEGPFLIQMTHGRSFSYSKESWDDFSAATRLIAVFNKATTDENYRVYLLK